MITNTADIDAILAKADEPEQDALELYLALQTAVGTFHPEDRADDIVHGPTGERLFTDAQAPRVEALADRAYAVAHDRGLDVCGLVLDILDDVE